MDILKVHRLLRKMSQYPNLTGLMRSIFMEVLEQRGIVSRDRLSARALEEMQKDGVPATESNLQEYTEALIDDYVAHSLTSNDIENYINLARKKDNAQNLSMLANRDQATSEEIVAALREFCDIPKGEVFISVEEAEGIRVALISRFISNQLPFISLAKNYITIRDTDAILQNTLFSRERPGKLGGKAAGMILAHKILLPTLEKKDPDLETILRVPDTWYLNSGVFSEFLDRNNLYLFHTFKYKDRESIEKEFLRIEEKFKSATFPPEVVEDFRRILDQIGEHPIIIRSSSMLEDNFGLAFSGKYQSVFLGNQGDMKLRLSRFIVALKKVFSSTFGPDPILYRRDHGLLDYDERMAMVVQKVVGRRFGHYFFPFAAGVMFSRNVFAWNPKIKREAGLVRLVYGLGTRSVDRVGSDYPRMIPLSHPQLRPEVTADQIRKYSQKQVDVLNLRTGTLETVDFRTLCASIDHPDLFYAVSVQNHDHLAAPMFKTQDLRGKELCLTFDNFLTKTSFIDVAQKILSRLDAAYGRPVDIEFAWDQDHLYLLQCRSLSIRKELQKITIPKGLAQDRILFTTQTVLCNSVVPNLEYLVYVDPRAYDRLPTYDAKMKIAGVVNLLNKHFATGRYALMGPGRWGSNDINLGVRVTYSNINKTKLLVEIAFAKEGYTPEVSYGTHFFQDLVEADILVVSIYPDEPTAYFDEQFVLNAENLLEQIAPQLKDCAGVVRVINVPSARDGDYLHVYTDGTKREGVGLFGPRLSDEIGEDTDSVTLGAQSDSNV
ncbi:MAG TPA: PEP/pyruvate-binding domain-containing protein [Candidatus Methylomirabilis sp.]|nr:PEP/pyruvate-binding domain-containing protein [Candidatus Methylomirabilis sp.]